MNISLNEWTAYRETLAKLGTKASEEFRDYFLKRPGGIGSASREEVIDVAYALVTKYGEGATYLACELYDEIAELSGVSVPYAIPAPTATYNETAKAINGCLKQSPTGQLVESVVKRLVKQAGADTTLQNAIRDHAEFAWIPDGGACAFCITLASRGWQRASKSALKGNHAEHIHANCQCEYAIRFGDKGNVEGYNPEEYAKMYYSESGNSQQKINAIRRKQYAKNKKNEEA